MENHNIIILGKRKHLLQEKHKNTKEAYIDESRNIGKKVGCVMVFLDITRNEILPEEASYHTIEITAIKP